MDIQTKARHFGIASLAAGAAFALAACSSGGPQPVAAADTTSTDVAQSGPVNPDPVYDYNQVLGAFPTAEQSGWTPDGDPSDVSVDLTPIESPQNACEGAIAAEIDWTLENGAPSALVQTYASTSGSELTVTATIWESAEQATRAVELRGDSYAACDGQTQMGVTYEVQPPLAEDWPTAILQSGDPEIRTLTGTASEGNVVISTQVGANDFQYAAGAIDMTIENLQGR